MTTIAYHKATNTIAYDSRSTGGDGSIHTDEAVKRHDHDGCVYFLSGSIHHYVEFLRDFEIGAPAQKELDVTAIRVDQHGLVSVCMSLEGEFISIPYDHNLATGTGTKYAVSAMDHGCNAVEAVEYAKTRDTNTGGKVHLFDIDEWVSANQD